MVIMPRLRRGCGPRSRWAEHALEECRRYGLVPAFDPFEDGLGEVAAGCPVVLVEELELQGAEEAGW